MSTLFVSPCLHDKFYGGVQKSGQLAFDAFRSSAIIPRTRMLCYSRNCDRSSCVDGGGEPCSHSKPAAMLRALFLRGRTRNIVFWHLDLLKLLPLIGRGRVSLFLHGIESWRRLDDRMQRLLANVDTFLTNSDFTWRQFTKINPEWKDSRHTTVALGLGEPLREAVSPGSVPAALIVGRLSRAESYKGHRELIEAWPMVVRERPDAELWIVGGGDGASDLEGLVASLRVEQRVRFFGPVSESEKERLLQAARCLVLPSRGEGFGLAYLEAMRHGRPCLTSDRDAGREVVAPPEAGMSVDPSDTRALAASVLRMLQPGSEWQDWSDGARRRYEALFTASHFQQRLLAAVLGVAQ